MFQRPPPTDNVPLYVLAPPTSDLIKDTAPSNMATKRKQDDKHLKILRELGTKPENKKCFDCEQRGPTYVNMTVGSFVCTRCSGILRGLNPPHRVKSISMTSFSPQEIEFLEKHGNEFCRQTWLGLDNSRGSSLESKDEQKVRDYMVQKYERKKWYIPASQVKLNNSSSNSTPEAQPLRQIVASDSPKTTLSSSSSSPPTTKVAAKISLPMPGAVPGPALQAHSKVATSEPSQQKPSMDLLGDLGGDPFSQPQQQPQQTAASAGGFANFGQAFSGQAAQGNKPATFDPFGATPSFSSSTSFNAFGQAAPQTGTSINAVPASASFNAFGAAAVPSQPASSGFAAFSSVPPLTQATGSNAKVNQTAQSLLNLSLTTSTSSSTAAQQVNSSADKYAIFSSLAADGASGSTGSGSIDWTGGGGSSSGGSIDWSGPNKASGSSLLSGGGIDWGPGSNTNIKQPTSSGLSLMSSGPNPFSGQSSLSGMQGQTNTQPVYTGSMGGLGSQATPQTSGFGAFGATQGVTGSMGPATGSLMNGGFNQPQGGAFPPQGGFGSVTPLQGSAPQGQMGGMGGGFGMQPQAGFPPGGAAMGGGMKAGFGTAAQPGMAGAGQGFGQGGFGGTMQGGFGAPTQPGMNTMQPVGMSQAAGAGLGLPGSMGTPQNAAGGMGFGAQPQGMTAATGGWPQQQSNPFMGQVDNFSSQQSQSQRSTNPFM
ncbi:arf-GAP domain and FG repeat-containing protein 1-like [Acanthaster planci]|uniref:Arf-GAP domain and FG repeat-containing protein 1-like n=1 Tax=Acanthaster planci TaxID=133434 RepID=A0A8B7YQW9_ACAPL|nr:arf-GAP domain and FG repeat-containing protein 1-like [Acanthaster planci]XP_022095072.1 arf-GAP domain and FG repeat-containing protein 1-like [Acanthaster planci]